MKRSEEEKKKRKEKKKNEMRSNAVKSALFVRMHRQRQQKKKGEVGSIADEIKKEERRGEKAEKETIRLDRMMEVEECQYVRRGIPTQVDEERHWKSRSRWR